MRLGIGQVELDAPADLVFDHHRLARRAEAPCAAVFIEVPAGLEPVEVALVDRFALALEVRPVRSAFQRAFVPLQPEPAQPVEDHLHRLGRIPRAIGIFYPQHESAAGVASPKPVKKGGARASHVQIAGGRRGKADTNIHPRKGVCLTLERQFLFSADGFRPRAQIPCLLKSSSSMITSVPPSSPRGCWRSTSTEATSWWRSARPTLSSASGIAQPDLILLNETLPDLDAESVCYRLLNDPATAGVPVVLMGDEGKASEVDSAMRMSSRCCPSRSRRRALQDLFCGHARRKAAAW